MYEIPIEFWRSLSRAKYVSQPASSPDTSVFAPAITTFWGEVSS
ncbi:hypothetical protein OGM63_12520 [Plectonema radiosum NIES-515]|uniref:Uncharacterized protein n=1 Tax=Plectonema radiosum NIES-515 TaxID=2986073 RepID=A0ABT3AYX7_9CYAN|nr:hypothetical protein [Plectonema radiosum]MCV3214324.1 hypothetical protein [Plectonema radiosum NIES-515]